MIKQITEWEKLEKEDVKKTKQINELLKEKINPNPNFKGYFETLEKLRKINPNLFDKLTHNNSF